jgi:hypothetical protein
MFNPSGVEIYFYRIHIDEAGVPLGSNTSWLCNILFKYNVVK